MTGPRRSFRRALDCRVRGAPPLRPLPARAACVGTTLLVAVGVAALPAFVGAADERPQQLDRPEFSGTPPESGEPAAGTVAEAEARHIGERNTPQARERRSNSRTAYKNLSAERSRDVAKRAFPTLFAPVPTVGQPREGEQVSRYHYGLCNWSGDANLCRDNTWGEWLWRAPRNARIFRADWGFVRHWAAYSCIEQGIWDVRNGGWDAPWQTQQGMFQSCGYLEEIEVEPAPTISTLRTIGSARPARSATAGAVGSLTSLGIAPPRRSRPAPSPRCPVGTGKPLLHKRHLPVPSAMLRVLS